MENFADIIIDTDGVSDDLLALYLILGCRKINVLGISLVGGSVNLNQCFANISYLFNCLNLKRRIPIVPGIRRPSGKDWQTCEDILGPSGLGFDIVIPPIKTSENIKRLIDFYSKVKKPFTLICLGPLTNIASILKYPKIRKKIKKIVSMGGNINIKGNTLRNVEFNYNADPKALREVLRSKIPVLIIPFDLTRKTHFAAEKLIPNINIKKKGGLLLSQLLESYITDTQKIKANAFHDPITAAIAINPSMSTYKKLILNVNQYGKLTLSKKKDSIQANVYIDIDETKLFKLYNNSIKNLGLL